MNMVRTSTDGQAHTRAVAVLSMAAGVASLALLAMHPGGQARDFAAVLREETANQMEDALVHGGFIVVSALQLVCYVVFSMRLGLHRAAVAAGLVFFAIGAAFLCDSMVMDGLVTPAIAAKYVGAPDKADFAKSLFVLIGALIGVLMPAGLFFQSLGVASWGFALLRSPSPSRVAGALAVTIGAVIVGALAVTFGRLDPLVLMGGIVALAVWAFAAGVLLLGRTGWSA